MWIILTIILAINSIWLLKVNKDLANRNEYLIRLAEVNRLSGEKILERVSDEQRKKQKQRLYEMNKDTDNKED